MTYLGRLVGKRNLLRQCPWCAGLRPVELPERPAGFAHCAVCGATIDPYQWNAGERAEFLGQYIRCGS